MMAWSYKAVRHCSHVLVAVEKLAFARRSGGMLCHRG